MKTVGSLFSFHQAAESETAGQDKKRNFDKKGQKKFDKKFPPGKQKQRGQKQAFVPAEEPVQPYKKKTVSERCF